MFDYFINAGLPVAGEFLFTRAPTQMPIPGACVRAGAKTGPDPRARANALEAIVAGRTGHKGELPTPRSRLAELAPPIPLAHASGALREEPQHAPRRRLVPTRSVALRREEKRPLRFPSASSRWGERRPAQSSPSSRVAR